LSRARRRFLLLALSGLVEHRLRPLAGDDAHAVVVGNDQIARIHEHSGADDWDVHAAERLLHRPLRRNVFRPDGKAHRGQIAHVAHAGFDDQTLHAVRLQRGREQLAEVAGVASGSGRDDQNVAFLTLLDGDVDHPVVARGNADGDRGAGDARAGIDRPHVGRHEADPALRLMHGRDADLGKAASEMTLDPRQVAHDDRHPAAPPKAAGARIVAPVSAAELIGNASGV
jgi:hypothetical protein